MQFYITVLGYIVGKIQFSYLSALSTPVALHLRATTQYFTLF